MLLELGVLLRHPLFELDVERFRCVQRRTKRFVRIQPTTTEQEDHDVGHQVEAVERQPVAMDEPVVNGSEDHRAPTPPPAAR